MKGLLLALVYVAALVVVSGCSHLTVHVHIALAEKVEFKN